MADARNDYEILKSFQNQLMREYGEHPTFRDDDFTTKLKGIHETLELLKRKLAVEKRHLMTERWETQSLYSIPSAHLPEYTSSSFYPTECTLPYCPTVDWTSYLITPNYDYEYYGEPVYNPVLPAGSYVTAEAGGALRDPSVMKLYRNHLEDVERMCAAELANMESSMLNLKKIRRDWNCHELNATSEKPGSRKKRRRSKHRRSRDYLDHYYYSYYQ